MEVWEKLRRHPNVLQLFGGGSYKTSSGTTFFFVASYCKEGNLVKYLTGKRTKSETLDWAAQSRIITDIMEGMKYLHSLNIVHGDLKVIIHPI